MSASIMSAHRASPVRARSLRVALVALLATLLVALAAPHRANAMFDGPAYAFPVPDYVSGLIGTSALTNAYGASGGTSSKGKGRKSRSKPKPPPKPKRATAAQRRTLRFSRTPAVTDAIYGVVVRRTNADPAVVVPQFVNVVNEWRRVMRTAAKWVPTDLGDSFTFAFLQHFRLYHGQSSFNAKGAELIRKEVRNSLALQKPVRRLTTARKQEAAEMVELRTIFLMSALETAQQQRDASAIAAARKDVREFAEETYGFDIAKVRVTSKGLQKR